ncbi:MAG: acetyl-CoA carboxylase biotin carboxylase subunit [Acidobacteriota bacterium]|nr:acetyl-CoA carboxylase biotin carboxylase subunit [Blastocatellia bacterium]MDW8239445.1 acetyl-CoA carboxylase biotin carboxylase subunit [Acidobacteriota bacterium]
MFRRLLVANRGEIALRIIRACRELGIETVAVHSSADRDSPHLRLADKSVCIGPAQSKESYLNMDAVLQAAEQYECQALHPGYGFLSENALFAERCLRQKIAFVGPPPHAIRLMGDKLTAKQTMQAAGLETIPGSASLLANVDEAKQVARYVGYPVLLKATAGGGGKGMRVCRDEGELQRFFDEAALEAEKAFGHPGLYLEKIIQGGRHIEFQVLGDAFGHVIHLGERECSVQRHHQKLVEESPSPVIDADTRRRMGERVVAAMKAIGYVSAGTVEFLRDADGRLYFMEMNTRLQVEHPVTEMVTGVDIVKEQIRIAANQPLTIKQDEVRWNGHAIECRINAEDPQNGFKPDPGCITVFDPPTGEALRLDTHVEAGYTIPPFYDSMIGKLIAHGRTRPETLRIMAEALRQFRIEGVRTTIPLHQRILAAPEFVSGQYDVEFLKRMLVD